MLKQNHLVKDRVWDHPYGRHRPWDLPQPTMAATQPTMGPCFGGSLTYQMLITAFFFLLFHFKHNDRPANLTESVEISNLNL